MPRCRHHHIALAFVIVAVACQSAPVSYVSLTPQPTTEAYSCALRRVNELGYTLVNADRESGFIKADRQKTGLLNSLTGREEHDRLTISIFDDSTAQRRKVRVTAETSLNASGGKDDGPSTETPSSEVVADANALLARCSQGPITQQSRASVAAMKHEG